jgi:hypothetical protein
MNLANLNDISLLQGGFINANLIDKHSVDGSFILDLVDPIGSNDFSMTTRDNFSSMSSSIEMIYW